MSDVSEGVAEWIELVQQADRDEMERFIDAVNEGHFTRDVVILACCKMLGQLMADSDCDFPSAVGRLIALTARKRK